MLLKQVVSIIDDDLEIRRSLAWLLESVELHAKTYLNAAEFLSSVQQDQSGCILLDVRMPGMSGLDLQSKLNELQIEIPVILITGHADVPMAVRALRHGAFDFIEKPYNDQMLLERVQSALKWDADRCVAKKTAENLRLRLNQLTAREHEVMQYVVRGATNKSIATALGLSHKTIEIHRAHVMEKLRVNSLAELVRFHMATSPHPMTAISSGRPGDARLSLV